MRVIMAAGWFLLAAIVLWFAGKEFTAAVHTEAGFGLIWAAVIMAGFLAAALANARSTSLPD